MKAVLLLITGILFLTPLSAAAQKIDKLLRNSSWSACDERGNYSEYHFRDSTVNIYSSCSVDTNSMPSLEILQYELPGSDSILFYPLSVFEKRYTLLGKYSHPDRKTLLFTLYFPDEDSCICTELRRIREKITPSPPTTDVSVQMDWFEKVFFPAYISRLLRRDCAEPGGSR